MSVQVGVIAEDDSDVEVLYELTCKLVRRGSFSFRHRIGHGCGKLRRKCGSWAVNLLHGGCSHLVVIHDLDEYDERQLRETLTASVSAVGFVGHLVLIPVREIEAWLLTDAAALRTVFRMAREPKLPANPESVADPKKKLYSVVWKGSGKRYVNTIHNSSIAAEISIANVKRCRSFQPYPPFVALHIPA